LWYIIVKDNNGFYVGYKSIFDTKQGISFSYYLQHHELIKHIADHENLQQLIRFSQGMYIIQQQQNKLVFNDLRFGQIDGWSSGKHSFIFHYVLIHPNDQKLLIQQGRLSQLNSHSMYSLLSRVIGN
jgi:inner membrane protein